MKGVDVQECQVHVMVCTNERPLPKACCKSVGGQQFYERMKAKLKESRLYDTHWITRSGCLGFCNTVGTTVAIYRKNREPEWLTEVTEADFDRVWQKIVGPT